MPYLAEGRKKELNTEPQRASTLGDYNYLFTKAYIKAFIDDPSYAMIAMIRRASLQPQNLEAVFDVENLLVEKEVHLLDRIVARDLAFVEFYDRIGHNYEVYARVKNGDLPEYNDAERAIIVKFGMIPKETSNG
jgi:hypothetical protein